jgi:hypothetical protein
MSLGTTQAAPLATLAKCSARIGQPSDRFWPGHSAVPSACRSARPARQHTAVRVPAVDLSIPHRIRSPACHAPAALLQGACSTAAAPSSCALFAAVLPHRPRSSSTAQPVPALAVVEALQHAGALSRPMRCMNHGVHAQRRAATHGREGRVHRRRAPPPCPPRCGILPSLSSIRRGPPSSPRSSSPGPLPPPPPLKPLPSGSSPFNFFRLGAASFALRYRILHTLHPPLPRHSITQDTPPRALSRRPA